MNLNFFEKVQEIFMLISKSPLFLTVFIIFLSVLTFLLIDIKSTNKLREKLVVFLWVCSIAFIGYSYFDYFIKLSDNLVEEVFTAIYFPNLAVFTIIVISTNFVFITKVFKKNINIYYKTCNLISTLIINFLLILILETIIKNKIDVYEPLSMYSNKALLILLQISTFVYTIWLLSIGLFKLVFNKIGEPVESVDTKVLEIKEDVPIYKPNFVYDAPVHNIYEKEENNIVPSTDNTDYANVFNFSPVAQDKIFYTTDLKDHLYIKKDPIEAVEEVKPEKIFYITQLEDYIYKKESVIEIEETVVKPKRTSLFKELFNSLKLEKKETLKPVSDAPCINDKDYKIPLFDTIDDPIMTMLNLNKDNELVVKTKVVENITVNIEEELYKKFKNGESLNVEQYKILKSYLESK